MCFKLIKALLFNLFVQYSYCNRFTRFHSYANLTILNQYLGSLKIQDAFQVLNRQVVAGCMLACSSNPNCAAAILDSAKECTLLSNKTTLIATIGSSNTTLFSKNQIPTCFDGFYPDFNATVCRNQKLNGLSCQSGIECLVSAGLECSNNSCQCVLPNYQLKFLIFFILNTNIYSLNHSI